MDKEKIKKYFKNQNNIDNILLIIIGIILTKVVKNTVLYLFYLMAAIIGFYIVFNPEILSKFFSK